MDTRPSEVAQIGAYRVLKQLGEGGMGVVYLAAAPDGGPVSLKTLRPWLVAGDVGRRRFERELTTLQRVRGRRVAEVIDADLNGETPYIVTRYVQGTALDDIVDGRGPLTGSDLTELARGLLEALASVHSAGVVHRDVKPANVLLSEDGPVLIDFGIAHAAEDTRLTATGFVSGTPGYLAPETVLGHDPTPATDVHAWAATVVFAASGRPPYGQGPDIAVLDRIRRGEHDLTGLSGTLAMVVGAALGVDPASRPSVAEALTVLDRPDTAETFALPPGAAANLIETRAVPPVGGPPAHWPAPPPQQLPPVRHTPPRPQPVTPPQLPVQQQPAPIPTPTPTPATQMMPARRRAANQPASAWRSRLATGLGALALVVLISWVPCVGALAVFGVLLMGRTTWRVRRRLFERRSARGTERDDALVATIGVPWDLLACVVPCLGRAVLALGAGLVAGALVGVAGAGTVAGFDLPYLAGGVVVVLLMWWGADAVRFRHGIRSLAGKLDSAPQIGVVVVGALGIAALLLVLFRETYGTLWWPASSISGWLSF